jgi:hypothetical protein
VVQRTIRRCAVVVLLCASISAVGTLPSRAAFPGANGRIVFDTAQVFFDGAVRPRSTACGRMDECDGGIASVRTDGTRFRLVTPNSGTSYNLADQSTAGGRMTYMRWHVGGVKMAIYVSRADGANERRITPPRLQGWFPDCRRPVARSCSPTKCSGIVRRPRSGP